MRDEKLVELLDNKKTNVRVENLAMSVGELISMYEDGELILKPEYQRLLKWKYKQKTLLIESLLLGLPTPSVFVSADKDGKWEIVDGLQRLSTIIDYIRGLKKDDTRYMEPQYTRFEKLSGDLVYLGGENASPTFEDKTFDDFPQKVQLELKRQRINVVILLSGTGEDVKYELFQRVNQGGTPITYIELRRAILLYKNPDVLTKIVEIGESELFRSFFPVSYFENDSLLTQAAIAFFLTFYQKSETIVDTKKDKVTSVDGYITSYIRNIEKDVANNDLNMFEKVLQKIKSLHLPDESKIFFGNQRYSETVFGAITLGITFNFNNLPDDQMLKEKIKKAYSELSEKNIAKRGFSASARIPKMIEFAHEYFSRD